MVKTFRQFPEYLAVDGTYKLLKIRATLFILVTVDGNLDTQIVGLSILLDEDEETIGWILRMFKGINTLNTSQKI
jgi:hypothetical protein